MAQLVRCGDPAPSFSKLSTFSCKKALGRRIGPQGEKGAESMPKGQKEQRSVSPLEDYITKQDQARVSKSALLQLKKRSSNGPCMGRVKKKTQNTTL